MIDDDKPAELSADDLDMAVGGLSKTTTTSSLKISEEHAKLQAKKAEAPSLKLAEEKRKHM